MRAALIDAQGPRRWRLLPYAPALAVVAGMVPAIALGAGGIAGVLFATALVATSIGGLVPMRQKAKRDVTLASGPGYVDVLDAGPRSQRIHTKDIYGATTARTKTGVSIALAHRGRDEPVVLEVATESEADEVRRALGIGHGGFGTIAWRTVVGAQARGALVGRILTLGATLAIAASAFAHSDATAGLAVFLGMFGFAGALAQLVHWLSSDAEPTIIMAPEGLRLFTTRGWFLLPYDQVQGIDVEGDHLFFRLPPPWFQVAVKLETTRLGSTLSADERAALLAQIRCATERAHGLGKQKDDRTARVETLRRGGASVRDWFQRLDMAGQMLAQSSAGYRGNSLEPDDLWAILEDPEADTELRTAAARVLRHSTQPETRVRIDAAVAAVREERTNKRLRVATSDDLEAATDELAQLEAEEVRWQMPPHLRFAQR